ncbi:hypothetical protein DCO16_02105 [Polynucleobacter antarcticus]|uniref:VWFA domain-containing protein n=2 Tax=Polynucleobacter antarcticus TaxID=1743162 RepID=A0A6M9PSV0_9BURK|nr:hypothetical protein DCO16_02105 [Polynucleobacter antarcticus]
MITTKIMVEKYQVSISNPTSSTSTFEALALADADNGKGVVTVETTITDETANDVVADLSSYDDNDAITIKIVSVDSAGNIINGGTDNSVLEGSGLAYYKVIAVNDSGVDVTLSLNTSTVTVQFTGDATIWAAAFNTTGTISDYSWFAQNGTTGLTTSIASGTNGNATAVGQFTTAKVGDVLSVSARSDSSTEGTEQFSVSVSGLSNASSFEKINYGGGVITSIGDSLVVSSVEVSEDSGTAGVDTGRYATFSVTYVALSGAAINLSLTAGTATAGTDYVNSIQYSLTGADPWTTSNSFTPTNAKGTLQVRVQITDDAIADSGETFTLTATRGAVTSTGTATIIDSTANDDGGAGNLTDNDTAFTFKLIAVNLSGVALSNVSLSSIGEESNSTAYYKVVAVDSNGAAVSNQPAGTVIVAVGDIKDTASPGFDYISDQRIEATIGTMFQVAAFNDAQNDGGETFTVSLVGGSYTPPALLAYEKIAYDANTVVTTITDTDTNPAVPIANPFTLDIIEGATAGSSQSANINTNLVLVIDRSGSMATVDSGAAQSRLAYAKSAALALIDKYDSLGNVSIQVVSFDSNAKNLSGSVWTDAATAKAAITALSAGSYTNYDRAIDTVMSTVKFTAAGVQSDGQNVSYFLSDGVPTEDSAGVRKTSGLAALGTATYEAQDIGIQAGEEWAWKNYLNANEINSNAIAIGKGMTAATATYLNPIAWNGETVSNANAILVDNITTLLDTLVPPTPVTPPTPAPTSYTYNLIDQAKDQSGPDGWMAGSKKMVSVEYNLTTYTFTDANPTQTVTVNGGTVVFSRDGSYTFTANANTTDIKDSLSSVITYTIQDSKLDTEPASLLGDTATNTFTINILDRSEVVAYDNFNQAVVTETITSGTTTPTTLTNFSSQNSASATTDYWTFDATTGSGDTVTTVIDGETTFTAAVAATETNKWITSSNNGSSFDTSYRSGSAEKWLRIEDRDSDAGFVASLFTPVFTGATSISFNAALASDRFASGDTASYQLWFKKADGTWGSNSAVSFTNTADNTTFAVQSNNLKTINNLTASTEYRLLLTVDDESGGPGSSNLRMLLDNFVQSNTAPATTTYSAAAITGNVILNENIAFSGTDPFGTVDSLGSEGATVMFASNGASIAGAGTSISSGGTIIAGTYGNLSLRSDGSYTYTMTSGATDRTGQQEVFTYRLQQADGDFSDASLTINLGAGTYVQTGTDAANTIAAPNNSETHLILGLGGNDTLTGGSGVDRIDGGDGDDSITGGAGDDILIGGLGNDTFVGFVGADTLDGGTGTDTLTLSETSADLNTAGATDGRLSSIENINASGASAITINLSGQSEGFTITGSANADTITGGSGADSINGGAGADSITGGTGSDAFVFSSGASGQTDVLADTITDYTVGALNTGDVIDFSQTLTVGGNANAATATQALINTSTGVATFASLSGATLADALSDITTRFTAATDTAGEFAFFKVNSTGNYFLFISDGVAGVGGNDVLIKLTGVTAITTIALNSGNLTITRGTYNTITVTPIAIDLNQDGINYLSQNAQVVYDYSGQNLLQSTAWVSSADGLLALKLPDNELQISFATQDGETDLQGLAKVYDTNKDGVFDSSDADFTKFGVWQDADSDGIVDSGEYLSLADRGITSLSLTSDGQVRFEANGDVIVYGQTTYTTSDGQLHIAEDVGFAVSDVYEPLDIAAIIANADAIESITHIDQLADTASSSTLMVELGGQTYEIATLPGQEVGTEDILSQFVGGDTSENLLSNKSWTDVIDIASDHGGPGSIIAAGGTLNDGNYANGAGDWTVIINSGDAKVDATNNQITFASESADNSVTIVTADGASHDINNVDKIQWHG